MPLEWSDLNPLTWPGQVKSRLSKDFGGLAKDETAEEKRRLLEEQGKAAGDFAKVGELGYTGMGIESRQARDRLRELAEGKDSLSAEQLRQGMQRSMAQQRSMAAGASAANAPMASLAAMQNMNRANMGLSGQQAMAGIAERQAAQQALANMIMQQRGQDMQVALGSRQNAIGGYGGITPAGSWLDQWSGPIASGAAAAAKFSDERLKEDVEDGDKDANAAIEGLRAYNYKYKDKRLSTNGGKSELGVMAQDLEKAGLKHTVFETPKGKAVHGAALSTANTAMIAALGRRVAELESGKKGGK